MDQLPRHPKTSRRDLQRRGGYSFYRDARSHRLTAYRYNNVPFDEGGWYIHLRDNDSEDQWPFTWQPTRCDLEDHVC